MRIGCRGGKICTVANAKNYKKETRNRVHRWKGGWFTKSLPTKNKDHGVEVPKTWLAAGAAAVTIASVPCVMI